MEDRLHQIGAIDYYAGSSIAARISLESTPLPESLKLKIGAPVMLQGNLNAGRGWTQGALCNVVQINTNDLQDSGDTFPVSIVTRTVDGTSYSRSHYPVLVAFATTPSTSFKA